MVYTNYSYYYTPTYTTQIKTVDPKLKKIIKRSMNVFQEVFDVYVEHFKKQTDLTNTAVELSRKDQDALTGLFEILVDKLEEAKAKTQNISKQVLFQKPQLVKDELNSIKPLIKSMIEDANRTKDAKRIQYLKQKNTQVNQLMKKISLYC